ncbi:MAG: transcription termination factor NusA [Planctomycetota bacterium]|mgnify:FL=1|nr:transcription termination factor NusA [Pirellulaceae bacterium]MEC7108842.1 transcription termination factor NusA [Planctomycetota bacterium]MEC8241059.1 transcription termination factor NusA [Planctomycetota bacterium]MEC8304436.1 transcription termination factor NusA [Planctomycetota bacterium]MEC8569843.1 transcription termination factor NusA [Planctomycetota bacterium]
MNANDLLRIVDSLHREKSIDKELVFRAIESALVTAAKKHYGEEAEVDFVIDREKGGIIGGVDGQPLDYEEVIGRIGAQTAKQVIIQKVREAERDVLVEEYASMQDDLISGMVRQHEGGATIVNLGRLDAILPRSEQIPGESHHANERVRAMITEVRTQGNRVKVVLSRTRPLLVQRLFEQEIPEIADGVINIDSISREPGYRSKVAVSSIDQRVDCVGACVGVRGNRIKNIVDELAGERIDIVRFDEDPQVLIRNALQPAEVDEVILCQMMGRAIVLVREDQLSLAIGRRGQNVRLASKLCGWDIEIMTQEELEEQIEGAVAGYCKLDGVDEELANRLVGEGYLSYDDLSVIEPDDLMEMGGLNEEQVDHIVNQAEEEAAKAEAIAEEKKRLQREQARLEAESGVVATPPVTETPSATEAEASAGTNAEASPDADAPTEAGGEEPS